MKISNKLWKTYPNNWLVSQAFAGENKTIFRKSRQVLILSGGHITAAVVMWIMNNVHFTEQTRCNKKTHRNQKICGKLHHEQKGIFSCSRTELLVHKDNFFIQDELQVLEACYNPFCINLRRLSLQYSEHAGVPTADKTSLRK